MAASPPPRTITSDAEPPVRHAEESSDPASRTRPKSAKQAKQLFEEFEAHELTDRILEEAAQLFSENYGVWGKNSTSAATIPKPGTRVRLSKNRLRAQYLPDGARCSYARITVEGRLVGHAFTCRWSHNDKIVCWITQLVVHRDFRERRLATSLLDYVRRSDDAICGIMSSHPAACLATATAFGDGIKAVSMDFIRDAAKAVMKASPIPYVGNAELRGSLFDPEDASGAVASVDTRFFVDHEEPLKALACVREGRDWPLGDLLEGHEFLLIIEVRRQ